MSIIERLRNAGAWKWLVGVGGTLGGVLGLGVVATTVIAQFVPAPEEMACQITTYLGKGPRPTAGTGAIILLGANSTSIFYPFGDYFGSEDMYQKTKDIKLIPSCQMDLDIEKWKTEMKSHDAVASVWAFKPGSDSKDVEVKVLRRTSERHQVFTLNKPEKDEVVRLLNMLATVPPNAAVAGGPTASPSVAITAPIATVSPDETASILRSMLSDDAKVRREAREAAARMPATAIPTMMTWLDQQQWSYRAGLGVIYAISTMANRKPNGLIEVKQSLSPDAWHKLQSSSLSNDMTYRSYLKTIKL